MSRSPALLRLRPARPTDAGALAEIVSASTRAKPWKPAILSAAEDLAVAGAMVDRGWTTLAELPGAGGAAIPAGFIAREGSEIHALFVAAAQTGRGIGKALIEDAKARAGTLTLWTFQANTGARRFYLREGFREGAASAGADTDHGLPDIRFHWQRKAVS